MDYRTWVNNLAYDDLGLLSYGGPAQDEQDLLIMNRNDIKILEIREHRSWLSGNDGNLLNFYSRVTAINLYYEPFYWKNKRAYFWSQSATETDYKRVTSGLYPAIITTIVNIIGDPVFTDSENRLTGLLDEDNFQEVFHDGLLPFSMTEGAGVLKISWDLERSKHPTSDYVCAEDVDLIKSGRHVVGMVFKNWYKDRDGRKYLVTEIRRNIIKEALPCLHISYRAFRVTDGDETQLLPIDGDFRAVPELADVPDDIEISNCPYLLAVPIWYLKDPEGILDGKPLLADKLTLFDSLDQSLSQSDNACRASTIERVYDVEFLDHDPETLLPIRPDKFNLKYTYSDSGPTADPNGGIRNTMPIQVIQPNVNFDQYSSEQMNIVTHILQGIVSPATMGIDVSRKDNANAQREKEKITVFTRNGLTHKLEKALKLFGKQYLICDDYLNGKGLDFNKYDDVAVKFSEFADTSFESRSAILSQMMGANVISPEQFVKRLYLDTLTKDEKKNEITWLNSHFSAEAQQQAALGGAAGEADPAGNWLPQNVEQPVSPEEVPPEVLAAVAGE